MAPPNGDMWADGEHEECVIIPSSLTQSPLSIEELNIGVRRYSDDVVPEFKLCGLVQLRRISIDKWSFSCTKSFSLISMIDCVK